MWLHLRFLKSSADLDEILFANICVDSASAPDGWEMLHLRENLVLTCGRRHTSN